MMDSKLGVAALIGAITGAGLGYTVYAAGDPLSRSLSEWLMAPRGDAWIWAAGGAIVAAGLLYLLSKSN
jgi:hypothetical protein